MCITKINGTFCQIKKDIEMKKRIILIAAIAIGLGVGGFFLFRTLNIGKAKADNVELATVTTTSMADVVEATGEFEVHPYAELTWSTSGTVEKVNVSAGQKVKQGDVLMSLQTTSVSASIISAKATLIDAQKKMDDLLNSDTNRAQAWIDLKDAKDKLDKAQDYRDSLNEKVTIESFKLVVVQTPMGPRKIPKLHRYKYLPDAETIANADADLALAKAQYTDAQRTYDHLKDGVNSDDLAAAQANVDAAQSTVNAMTILAPFDGEILYVDTTKGDVVTTGKSALIMADTNHYYVNAQVDEADISTVRVGQEVAISSDGMSGVTLSGLVDSINPVGENLNGLIKYTVNIALDPAETQIMLGSTANLVITVSPETTRSLVPLSAIQNGSDGEFIQVQVNGQVNKVAVVTREIVGNDVVISGDVQPGDQVVINASTSTSLPGFNSGASQ
jgi:HlyD family secretion protein